MRCRQTDLPPVPQKGSAMTKKIPLHPKRHENICWGCEKYCPANAMRCGNGSERTPHPVELFGEDWLDWALDAPEQVSDQKNQSG